MLRVVLVLGISLQRINTKSFNSIKMIKKNYYHKGYDYNYNYNDEDEDEDEDDYYYNKDEMVCTITDGRDASRCSWEVVGKRDYWQLCRESICVKGMIYWLVQYKDSILAFDLERQEHKIIPLPDLEREQHENIPFSQRSDDGLIDFGGSVCLVRSSRGKVSAWTLTDLKSPEWVPESMLRFIPRSVEDIVYSSMTEEGIQIAVSSWNEMFWYDGKQGTLTRCCRKMGKSKMEKEDYPRVYVESLY